MHSLCWCMCTTMHSYLSLCMQLYTCARLDVAKVLNIPEDNALLDDILAELENDMDWDTNNPIGAIYKKKGLKRYKLQDVMGFKETTIKETNRDVWSATTGGSSASGLHASPGAPSTIEFGVQIKIENPDHQNLQQLGQGPMVGHTQEGVLSAVPPWARLVPAPVAVDQQAALPRTRRRLCRQVNGLPHTPVLVTLVVVMPAVVMSAVVVAVTPVYLAWGGVQSEPQCQSARL